MLQGRYLQASCVLCEDSITTRCVTATSEPLCFLLHFCGRNPFRRRIAVHGWRSLDSNHRLRAPLEIFLYDARTPWRRRRVLKLLFRAKISRIRQVQIVVSPIDTCGSAYGITMPACRIQRPITFAEVPSFARSYLTSSKMRESYTCTHVLSRPDEAALKKYIRAYSSAIVRTAVLRT